MLRATRPARLGCSGLSLSASMIKMVCLLWSAGELIICELFEHIKIWDKQKMHSIEWCESGDHLLTSGGGMPDVLPSDARWSIDSHQPTRDICFCNYNLAIVFKHPKIGLSISSQYIGLFTQWCCSCVFLDALLKVRCFIYDNSRKAISNLLILCVLFCIT